MRIFVASTYEELLDYRAAVTRSVLAGGNSPEDMIDWPADDSPALDVSIRKVRASDLIILIVAHGYGNPPPNESKSVTELEFDEAVRLRIPVIAFIVNPGHAWPPKYIEIDPRRRRCREAFIARIEETVTRGEFSSPESLELAVTKALAGFRARKVDGKEVQVAFPERLQTVYRPESLHYKPDALVWIGKAPDGAPMAFSVLRNVSLTREISDLAQRFHKTLADAPFDDIHETLSQEARDYAVAADLHTGRAGRSIEDVYLYPRALVSIFAPSLFQSMLQAPGYTSQARASIRDNTTARTVRRGP
jgi:hypothetical protein